MLQHVNYKKVFCFNNESFGVVQLSAYIHVSVVSFRFIDLPQVINVLLRSSFIPINIWSEYLNDLSTLTHFFGTECMLWVFSCEKPFSVLFLWGVNDSYIQMLRSVLTFSQKSVNILNSVELNGKLLTPRDVLVLAQQHLGLLDLLYDLASCSKSQRLSA